MSKRRLIRTLFYLIIILGFSSLGISLNQTGELDAPRSLNIKPGYHEVVEVIDGDTIVVKIAGKNETVRYIGIDTPETKDPRKPVQCFGKASTEEHKRILKDKVVRLEGDPTNTDRDVYKRLLRYVYLEDGTFVNQHMVQSGHAFAYTVFPNSKLEEFRTWEKEARENNRGLWAGCQVNESDDKRRTQDQL